MSIISSSLREYPRSLLLILILGLLLRILFISFHDRPLFSDEKEYDQLAYNLATKAIYSYDSTPTAYRPVGYPVIVGWIYYVFGHHIILVRLLQALFDTLISFFIYLLLAGHPPRTRVCGSALWALFPPAIFYSSLLLSETIFTFLFVVSAWMLTRNDSASYWKLAALGAVVGVLTLIKPTVIVFVLLLSFLLPQVKLPFRRIYPVVIAFLLVLAPWLIRNYLVFSEIALSSNGGVNLMIGNNATSTGAYKYTFDPIIFHDSKGEFDVDHKALRYAANYIVSNPIATAMNAARKTGRLFESEGALLVLTFYEDPDNASTRYVTKYASLPLFWILVTNFSYFIIVLAAIFGFLSAERKELWWIVLAAFTSWIIVHAVFFGGGRFHFPLMPLITVYAAQFVIEPRRPYQSLSGFRKVLAFSVLTLLCILWIIEACIIFYG